MTDFELFKYYLLHSECVRAAHGMKKTKEGKLEMVDKKKIDALMPETKALLRLVYRECGVCMEPLKAKSIT